MQRQTNVCDKAKGALSVDVTRREMGLEAELDRLIAKHHDRRVAEGGAAGPGGVDGVREVPRRPQA
jgi:hypothetical protein